MLRTLPPEIWCMTFDYISDKPSLCNILAVCRHFRRLVEPILYADAAFPTYPMRAKLDSFLDAIEGPRALLVRTLNFDALDIRHHELEVIDSILIKTPNLKFLSLRRPTLPHVQFLETPPFLLTSLKITFVPLDPPFVRFLESQTSLEYLSLQTFIRESQPVLRFSPTAFPNLKALAARDTVLGCFACVPLSSLTHFHGNPSGLLRAHLNTLLVLCCHVRLGHLATLCANIEWLQIHGSMDASSDIAHARPSLRLRGIRVVLSPTPLRQAPANFEQHFDAAPSLEFVEICSTAGPHHVCHRWYRGSHQPIEIRWKCKQGSEWQADWLKDVDILTSQLERSYS
ncbi:hypothetical protein BDN71DRAFT_1457889, partial [Pleurotus eryngii]